MIDKTIKEEYDVIIVGGGITGAGILRQARWVARGGSAARPWLAARLLWLPPAALLMTLLPRPLLPPAAGGQASVEGRDAVEGLKTQD